MFKTIRSVVETIVGSISAVSQFRLLPVFDPPRVRAHFHEQRLVIEPKTIVK